MHRQSIPRYLAHYPQVYPAAPLTKDIVDSLHMDPDPKGSVGKFELEARFGILSQSQGLLQQSRGASSFGKETFIPGVSKRFMDACLAKMEEYGGWDTVTPWTETHDYYYELPPAPEDFNDRSILVRTTTEFLKNDDGITTCMRSHMCKHTKNKHDFRFVAAGSVPEDISYDLRISLKFEEVVPEDLLPQAVPVPTHVRIKSRKSYRYKSSGLTVPVWSFDFTQSWSGSTFDEAEQNQKIGNTAYEIEVECLDPYMYLNSTKQDQFSLATSLLLKMRDFIGSNVPYHWEPVRK